MRHQRIAEGRVREKLAGRDLVVGDDPVTEANVPPDVRITQRVQPDCAGEDQDGREERPARVRDPGQQTARRRRRVRCGRGRSGPDERCHASAA